ncbi:Bifunctional dihydrofolate reductase-thymidylate synthase 1-like protein [Drosera capensis]
MASSGDRTAMLGNGAADVADNNLGHSYPVVVAATREMVFQPWHASLPLVENGVRFPFVTYVRVRRNMADHDGQENGSALDCKSSKFQTQELSFLPRMVADSHEEYKYLQLVQEILSSRNVKEDRTGTESILAREYFGEVLQVRGIHIWDANATRSHLDSIGLTGEEGDLGPVYGFQWRHFGAREYFGEVLQVRGIHIWDANATRSHLDSIGLTGEEGDLGPVYGFQWRHFGARYTTMHVDYTGQGVDKLSDVIHKIKNNPNDR